MRFLSRTTNANEHQEKADYLAFDISPGYARLLIARRESVMAYLKSLTVPDHYQGDYLFEVRLAWLSSLNAFSFCAYDDTPDEIVDLFDNVADGDVWPLPESFVIDEDDCARLGPARIVIDLQGDLRLYTYDDHSGADIESETFGVQLLEQARNEAVSGQAVAP